MKALNQEKEWPLDAAMVEEKVKRAPFMVAARWLGVLCALGTLGFSSAAGAQQEQPSLALNRFQPAPAGDRFFGVQDSDAGSHLVPHAILILDYAHNPLVLEYVDADGDTVEDQVVEHQLTAHVGGAIGLWGWLKADVSVPVALYQAGSDLQVGQSNFQSPDNAAFGDVRLGARSQLWQAKSGAVALGLGGYLWLPTGPSSEGSFTGDGMVRGLPYLGVSGQVGRFVYASSLGLEFREGLEYGGTTQGDRFQLNAAAGVLLGEKQEFQIGPEVNMGLVLADVAKETTNAEALLGAKWQFHPLFVAGLGAGGGLAGGVGTPQLRALASLALSPKKKSDSDGDGIDDDKDACLTIPGERSADPSKHGCPSDSDGDGIIDANDACPRIVGVSSEDPDKHGCPPDSDGDGIVDEKDACPQTQGAPSDDAGKHGCPPDSDGDGIIDARDACPNTFGQPNEDDKKNGCPPDRDGDGVLDDVDACPDEPGAASEDTARSGCPDKDADGILDKDDACPSEWGRASDDEKKHGCPAVQVSSDKIVILQKVQFETGSADIKSESLPLIDEIAQLLKANPHIAKVEVQGHTDNRGGAWLNTKLSKERAASVRAALIERGIEEERLTSAGYGLSRPVASNATAEGREKNRRVEIKILKTDRKETKE